MFEFSKEIVLYVNLVKLGLSAIVYFSMGNFIATRPAPDKNMAQANWFTRMAHIYKVAPSGGKTAFWVGVCSLVAIIGLHILVK